VSTSVLVIAVRGGTAQAQSRAQRTSASPAAGKPLLTLQMPAPPDPVRLSLTGDDGFADVRLR
jgi:hypothetical protein